MQEKTLEEEFESRKIKQESDGEYPYIMMYGTIEELTALISSREDKAREEGRKEANRESYWDINKSEAAITQYKEELLGKIDEHCKKVKMEEFTLSEVKKLIS